MERTGGVVHHERVVRMPIAEAFGAWTQPEIETEEQVANHVRGWNDWLTRLEALAVAGPTT